MYYVNSMFDVNINESSVCQSVTGNVAFKRQNGDRDNGMYSYGFINEDGEIEYFGYSYWKTMNPYPDASGEDDNNTKPNVTKRVFMANVSTKRIVWPKAFTDKGLCLLNVLCVRLCQLRFQIQPFDCGTLDSNILRSASIHK